MVEAKAKAREPCTTPSHSPRGGNKEVLRTAPAALTSTPTRTGGSRPYLLALHPCCSPTVPSTTTKTSRPTETMDRYPQLDELLRRAPTAQYTIPSILAYAIGAVFFLHQLLVYLDIAVLSPLEVTWNALVYLTPSIVLLNADRRNELRAQDSTWSQIHAAKSESLRSMLGLGSRAVMQQLPGSASLVRSITSAKSKPQSDAPPGLGNWDNSCYQNSVLQGLSSMDSLKPYLSAFSSHEALPTDSTSSSLQEVVQKLNNASLNGTHIWTPAKLKSMSSWQQQDAQEYYSKIVDDLEKEASKVFGAAAVKPGLENSEKKKIDIQEQMAAPPFSVPLEGLLAQRVACTRCGYSEGLSMIPFNCLTVPLGSSPEYDLSDCLNEYTHIEDIPEVECAKCTLLRAKTELSRMLPKSDSEADTVDTDGKKAMQLPPALLESITKRLQAVTEALAADDFSDKTLKEVCQISKKAHTSSTKTRQAVIGRAPRSLVIHINRSVFDEMTGDQKKNYAAVRYPQVLDLGKWMLGSKTAVGDSDKPKPIAELAITQASESMLVNRSQSDECLYRLKAVITHYGRHENGHYIAYRQHPPASHASDETVEDDGSSEIEDPQPTESGKLPWWRLSDEDVSSVPDEDVLQQGGVFMLFYEREESQVDAPAAPASNTAEAQDPTVVAAEPSTEQQDEVEASQPAVESTGSSALTETSKEDAVPAASKTAEENAVPVASSGASTSTTTEDEESETDTDDQPVECEKPVPKTTTQPLMRTARVNSAQSDSGFPSPHRVIAAT
jgi:ubiquitin carboxyl-terminal hydrolase 1